MRRGNPWGSGMRFYPIAFSSGGFRAASDSGRREWMGTVGLSFGSPTSGAGFDVSSTVAEIVGNLQNVETPWKNQLTSLESQDTAISSLGTLFSNLSNDMSSLTDFQGIMAQKDGLELGHQRADADGGDVGGRGGNAHGGGEEPGPDLERLPGADRQQRGHAVRLGHAAGGQRHGADHHAQFLRQHAGRAGGGDQLRPAWASPRAC